MLVDAVADERPKHLWDTKPVGERGSSSAVPSNPNSRLGRKRSPIRQGWEKMDATFVGIDVSQDWLDVHVLPSGESFRIGNADAGIAELRERLARSSPERIALEATGGLERLAVAALAGAGLPVVVVNPAQVRAFADALGKRARTDPIDAAVIPAFTAAVRPELRPLPDEATRALTDLVARRRQIIQMIVAEENRLRAAGSRQALKSIRRLLAALKRELEVIDADIDAHIRKSPLWRVRETLLVSMPGIGPTVARTLLAELPELAARSLRSPGWPLFTRQSGKWRGKSFIGDGRSSVRAARGHSPQSRPQGIPRPSRCRREGQNRCRRRNHAQTAHNPQRHDPEPKTMGNRLTAKTVALPARGRGIAFSE